jgi:hypothetical protein
MEMNKVKKKDTNRQINNDGGIGLRTGCWASVMLMLRTRCGSLE